MKKIFVICVASALMFTGCSDKPDKETESGYDMSSAVTSALGEGYENGSESKTTAESLFGSSTKEYIVKSTTDAVDFKEKLGIVTTVSTENKSHGNASSGYARQEELPIMNNEVQESKAGVTTALESSKIHTTVTTTAVTKDDVIELPFVPVKLS